MFFAERKLTFKNLDLNPDDKIQEFEGLEYRKIIFQAENLGDVADLISLVSFDTASAFGRIFFELMKDNKDFKIKTEDGGMNIYEIKDGKEVILASQELDKGLQVKRIVYYNQGQISLEFYTDIDPEKGSYLTRFYDKEGKLYKESSRVGKIEYEKDGKTPYRWVYYNKFGAPTTVVNKDGTKIDLSQDNYDWDIMEVRKVYQGISSTEFLALLATWLDTPEKLNDFLQNKMHYVHDSNMPTENGRYIIPPKGKKIAGADYWQFPFETVQRYDYENKRYYGDCDDYAFLARAILDIQDKDAQVIGVPSHATTVWTEKRGDKFVAFDIGTYKLAEFEAKTKTEAIKGVLKRYVSIDQESFEEDPFGFFKETIDKIEYNGMIQSGVLEYLSLYEGDPKHRDFSKINVRSLYNDF